MAAVGSSSPSRVPLAQTPKPGGTVRVSHLARRNLDPAKQVSGDEYADHQLQVFETRSTSTTTASCSRSMAESWEKSPDLRTWTFNLRKGVQFHHGREMNAEDVKTTIEHVLDPKTGCTLRTAPEMIEAIETPNPYQVRFRLKFGYAELDAPLSSREASIVAKEENGQPLQDVSGTGPFRFRKSIQGDRAGGRQEHRITGARACPTWDEVVFEGDSGGGNPADLDQKGDTDIFWQVPFDLVDQIEEGPRH